MSKIQYRMTCLIVLLIEPLESFQRVSGSSSQLLTSPLLACSVPLLARLWSERRDLKRSVRDSCCHGSGWIKNLCSYALSTRSSHVVILPKAHRFTPGFIRRYQIPA